MSVTPIATAGTRRLRLALTFPRRPPSHSIPPSAPSKRPSFPWGEERPPPFPSSAYRLPVQAAIHLRPHRSPAPRPTVVAALALEAYGGGRGAEALLVVVAFSVLLALGLGSREGPNGLTLGLTNLPWLQVVVVAGAATMTLGAVVSLATDTAFQGRYGVFALVPLVLGCAVGLQRMTPRSSVAALALLVLLSGVSVAREVSRDRTQIGEIADVVKAEGSTEDLVVFCPDQLAPAGSRLLADGFITRSYPALDDGRRVDWVDYAQRNAGVDVDAVADAIAMEAAGSDNVWLAWMDGYLTFEGQCPRLRLALAERLGRPVRAVHADSEAFDDAANLSRFPGGS